MKHPLASAAASIATALLIAACGGSSPPAAIAPPAVAAAVTLSGTTATGAAFIGATITVTDKTGAIVGTTNTINADGTYSITLSSVAVFPVVLTAVRDDQTLVSVATDNTATTINITPITNLIAARLSTSGDPAKLAAEIVTNPTIASVSNVSAKLAEVVAILQPLLTATNTSINPLTGSFVANGTGLDLVLDSLTISIVPSSATTSNIEIAVKQASTDALQPPALKFTNTEVPAPVTAPTTLIKPGTATLIANLLSRITACYAIPAATRVTKADPISTDPIETAADVLAPACKEIFAGSNPANYLSNGRTVGSRGAFSSLFRSGADGAVFDRGTYEFTRVNSQSTNGDIVISYRFTDKDGNVNNESISVRGDNLTTPTKYQIVGNQYVYDGGVSPNEQLRTFLKDASNDYYSTGYTLNVRNDGNFSKVVVTAPNGTILTLKPNPAFSNLQLVRESDLQVLSTNFVRIRSEYIDPAKASLDPATADRNLFFSVNKPTDTAITAIAEQTVWTFDYYLTSAPTAIAATQKYRTRSRALSIAELKQKILPNVTPGDLSSAVALIGSGTSFAAPTTAPVMLDWIVPTGGIAPTSINIFGSYADPAPATTRSGFSDGRRVGSTSRSGAIQCFKKDSADTHCNGSNFSSSARINGFNLVGNDRSGREYTHFYATYTIPF